MTPEEERLLELLQREADSAQQLIPFLRMKMKQAGIWTDLIEETFKRYDFAHRSAQTFASDDEKSAWEQMGDLKWLDYVVRNVHLVRTNGESEDEDMLICNVALHSHFTVTIKAHSFRDLILKGQEFEQTRLKRPSEKGK